MVWQPRPCVPALARDKYLSSGKVVIDQAGGCRSEQVAGTACHQGMAVKLASGSKVWIEGLDLGPKP